MVITKIVYIDWIVTNYSPIGISCTACTTGIDIVIPVFSLIIDSYAAREYNAVQSVQSGTTTNNWYKAVWVRCWL